MNVLQHTRIELNLCLKQNRPDRSYRDTLLNISLRLAFPDKPLTFNEHIFKDYNGENQLLLFCIEKPSTVTNIYKAKQGCS